MMIRALHSLARVSVLLLSGVLVLCAAGVLVRHVFAEEKLVAKDGPITPAAGSPSAESKAMARHPVIIRQPKGTPKIKTGAVDAHGNAVEVACVTCHATTTPNPQTNNGTQLKQFHQGLNFVHGGITCLSCHNSADYNTLHLADSRSVDFSNVMQLCGQCHGHQLESYKHGAHGGMNGHWDLTRGSRTRNTCTNCHDPHAPKFPLVQPIFPPKDRISVPLPKHRTQKTHETLPETP